MDTILNETTNSSLAKSNEVVPEYWPTGDEIAGVALKAFQALSAKFKPRRRTPKVQEWTVLSAIVVSWDQSAQGTQNQRLECVALGTGLKCLARSKIPTANGNVLHDSHAEILAIRAFNRLLLNECLRLSQNAEELSKLIVQTEKVFTINPDIRIHMYSSEAPCGDASMELVMNAQEDAAPWERAPTGLPGRGDFSQLGVVRRKPARADAPQSLSKSCTDKLTLCQFISLLRGIASLVIDPSHAYIATLTLPESQYVRKSMDRAFSVSGRLANIKNDDVAGPYSLQPFKVQTTTIEFPFSRRVDAEGASPVSAPTCMIWTRDFCENITNGIVQGKRPTDSKAPSSISRRRMMETVMQILKLDQGEDQPLSYKTLKEDARLSSRRQTKHVITQALSGWVSNQGDELFTI